MLCIASRGKVRTCERRIEDESGELEEEGILQMMSA